MLGVNNQGYDPEYEDLSQDTQKRESLYGASNETSILLDTKENGVMHGQVGTIPFTGGDSEIRVYWYRWYVLALFSCLPSVYMIGRFTWGPIETSSRAVYGWSKGSVSLLNDWGAIVFTFAAIPSAYLLDVKGIRKSMLFASFCMAAGSALRCITTDKQKATYLIHVGQILMGAAGPIAMGTSTALSSTWFPPEQRTLATSISSLTGWAGLALSSAVSTHMIHDIDQTSQPINKTSDEYFENLERASGEIMSYLYLQCGVFVAYLCIVFFTLPSKPPKPPSVTASKGRTELKSGIVRLFRNPQFLMMAFVYGLSNGILAGWFADLALNLIDFNIYNGTVGWLVFSSCLASPLFGIISGSIGSYFRKLKKVIAVMFLIGAVCFLVFTLVAEKIIPYSTALLFLSCILGCACVNGVIPMLYELAVESSYPVAEGVNTVLMNIFSNVFGTIFLTLPLINGVGTDWMNGFLVASCIVCIPVMLIFKERYTRRNVDTDEF